MLNFLGALQPAQKLANGKVKLLERVCGKGQCKDYDDAKSQLRTLYRNEYPQHAAVVDDEAQCMGGVFVFDCSPYELIEKAADEESADIIRKIYEAAIELAPFVGCSKIYDIDEI